MVHTFSLDENYYIFDSESCSLLKADKLASLLVDKMSGKTVDLSEYSSDEIAEAASEFEQLKQEGILFAEMPSEVLSAGFEGIKSVCLHICHDCNLACSYCFAGGGTFCGDREYMDFATAKAAIDFLIHKSGSRKNLEVDFFGGEPLMNMDVVKQTVSYARAAEKKYNKIFKFTITTNALLLNDEMTEYFNKEMDNVVVSIDGREKVHNAMRPTRGGRESFSRVMSAAKRFRQLRGDKSYYIRGTYTSENLDFSEDVLFLADSGFDQISVEPVVLDEGDRLAIKDEHIAVIDSQYKKLARKYIERRRDKNKWFNFFHFYVDLNNSPCLKKKLTGCGAGSEYLAVVPGGDIFPCHQFAGQSDYCIGSVFDGDNLNKDIVGLFYNSSLLTKPHCKDCFAKYFCSGGCAANNIKYSGNIDGKYGIYCQLMRSRFEASLAVYAEENIPK